MERVVALVVTLCVGGLIAFQPPANALLSRHVGDLGAAFASLALSTLIIGVLLLVAGEAGALRGLREVRPEHAPGGIAPTTAPAQPSCAPPPPRPRENSGCKAS